MMKCFLLTCSVWFLMHCKTICLGTPPRTAAHPPRSTTNQENFPHICLQASLREVFSVEIFPRYSTLCQIDKANNQDTRDDPELLVLRFLPPKCWGWRCVSHTQLTSVTFTKAGALVGPKQPVSTSTLGPPARLTSAPTPAHSTFP